MLHKVVNKEKSGFTRNEVTSIYNLGSRSNLVKLQTALVEKEIVDMDTDGSDHLADPLFEIWFKRKMM